MDIKECRKNLISVGVVPSHADKYVVGSHPNVIVRHTTARSIKVLCCNDCSKVNVECYMINNDTWKSVVPERRCFLCLNCLEGRLGRKLCIQDFPRVIVNELIFKGHNMKDNNNV